MVIRNVQTLASVQRHRWSLSSTPSRAFFIQNIRRWILRSEVNRLNDFGEINYAHINKSRPLLNGSFRLSTWCTWNNAKYMFITQAFAFIAAYIHIPIRSKSKNYTWYFIVLNSSEFDHNITTLCSAMNYSLYLQEERPHIGYIIIHPLLYVWL